jgi:hypothetical protein
LFSLGQKDIRSRCDTVGEKNIERSALKSLQQREALKRPARDPQKARTGQHESDSPQHYGSRRSARP